MEPTSAARSPTEVAARRPAALRSEVLSGAQRWALGYRGTRDMTAHRGTGDMAGHCDRSRGTGQMVRGYGGCLRVIRSQFGVI